MTAWRNFAAGFGVEPREADWVLFYAAELAILIVALALIAS